MTIPTEGPEGDFDRSSNRAEGSDNVGAEGLTPDRIPIDTALGNVVSPDFTPPTDEDIVDTDDEFTDEGAP